ncbi:HNH endonuclease family protein [Kitasatospora sp. NPDC057223]|uniref:HNH endonuclease family protein n=1 Tax=Kitasatospora sp. NPDC057223 TaxID=3346055 RepID=UPI00362AB616
MTAMARAVLTTTAAAALLAGTAAPAGAAPVHAADRALASSAVAGHREVGQVVTAPLRDAIEELTVAEESRAGYVRTAFKHWVDADHDGCNTRKEVILREAVEAPEVGPGCTLTGGRWYSIYDGVTVTDASALDVDHVVPLAEAWDSGASAWTAAERQAYANDLDEPRDLVAVTARSNRQKADKDIAEWRPIEAEKCDYVARWTVSKTRWGQTVDTTEKNVLRDLAATCPNETLTISLAR